MTTEFFPCRHDGCDAQATLPSGFCSKRCYHRQYSKAHRAARNAAARERYASDPTHRDNLRRASKKYLATGAGQVTRKVSQARFYERHLDYHRDYAANHSTVAVERTRQWRLKHPERTRELARINARARRKGLTTSPEALAAIREWQRTLSNDPCVYCGAIMTEIDHIVPLVNSGDHAWSNLTSACKPCNASKGGRSLLTFLRLS